jgi:hypothetical protein
MHEVMYSELELSYDWVIIELSLSLMKIATGFLLLSLSRLLKWTEVYFHWGI